VSGEPSAEGKAPTWGCLKAFLLVLVTGLLGLILFQDQIVFLVFEEYDEGNVTSRLRGITGAQERFRADLALDTDGDGKGEYGLLAELMAVAVAGRPAPTLRTPNRDGYYGLMGGFLDPAGVWAGHEAWCYVLYLPSTGGEAVCERREGPRTVVDGAVDADGAEQRWWAYGWPRRWGKNGKRAFYVDAKGRILVCRNRTVRYEASERVPLPGAAFPPGAPADGTVPPVPGAEAADGEVWEVWRKPK
jgi:hypothetical protein